MKLPLTSQLFGSKEGGLAKGFIKLLVKFITNLKSIEIVHFVVLSPYNIPFLLLAKLYQKRVVTSYHGIYALEASILDRPHIFIQHWIADKMSRVLSDSIISPSEYLKQTLKLESNVAIIPYPADARSLRGMFLVDRQQKRKENEEIVLVTATNFNIKKKSEALHVLLEAVHDIVLENNSLRLLVFGDGEELPKFKSQYVNMKNIFFMGFRKDFRNFLAASDGYIHISGLDNQPYSIIDALMLGKVIVCNRLEGLLEMLDADNNYVVPLEPFAVGQAIRSLID